MTTVKHEFGTIQAIANELKIKRQTLYNRAKKTNVDISKKKFTDEEWTALVNNEKLTDVNNVNDEKLTRIDILNQQINDYKKIIDVMERELQEKNKQIDQAQQLQLIAETRLNETRTQLIEYQDKNEVFGQSYLEENKMADEKYKFGGYVEGETIDKIKELQKRFHSVTGIKLTQGMVIDMLVKNSDEIFDRIESKLKN